MYSNPRHKLIPDSRRLGTIPGHLAAAVYEVHQSRTILVGIYGPSENDCMGIPFFRGISIT